MLAYPLIPSPEVKFKSSPLLFSSSPAITINKVDYNIASPLPTAVRSFCNLPFTPFLLSFLFWIVQTLTSSLFSLFSPPPLRSNFLETILNRAVLSAGKKIHSFFFFLLSSATIYWIIRVNPDSDYRFKVNALTKTKRNKRESHQKENRARLPGFTVPSSTCFKIGQDEILQLHPVSPTSRLG